MLHRSIASHSFLASRIAEIPFSSPSSSLLPSITQLFILLSCALAVVCNASQYICIGRFSAVSFQVLGHTKTLCVLTLGWMLFDSALTVNNVLGMILAVLGMIFYSSSMEAARQGQQNPPLPGAEDEEAQPLNDRPNGAGQAKA